jgi:hypothetical protein
MIKQKYYFIARKEFQEINVYGSDIQMDEKSKNYLRHEIGLRTFKCQSCLSLMWKDEKSKGSNVKPIFSICCLNGAIRIPCLPQKLPDFLYNTLTADNTKSIEFRNKIRFYNSTLAFTSIKSNHDKELISSEKGCYSYRINGTINHFISDIIPHDSKPKFAQIYIFDPQEQLQIRNECSKNLLNQEILENLQSIIQQKNPFVKLFKQAYEISKEQINPVRIVLKHTKKNDKTYKLPTAEELAIIIPFNNESCEIQSRDIVIHTKSNGKLQRINELHSLYDPLHYVLIFPNGDTGWDPYKYRKVFSNQQLNNAMLDNSYNQEETDLLEAPEEVNNTKEKFVTAKQYYCYLLHERESKFIFNIFFIL